jgi:hypothetical protein
MGIMKKEHHIINLFTPPSPRHGTANIVSFSVPGRTKNTYCIRTMSDAVGHVHRAALWEGPM